MKAGYQGLHYEHALTALESNPIILGYGSIVN